MWIVKLQTELNFHRFNKAIVLLLVLYAPFLQAMENSNPQLAADTLFASIDGQTISQAEFTGIFEAAVRHKYYHGRVPQEELEKFRKQVAEDIILQILLHREAKNLGLQPDRQKIRQGLDE
ncbi:MAG: hypothetical protein HOK37_08690, partial [Gammaproteobacteria bacterium]|nr:hypothetical protein [Gammaproteobacteria bacterium]